MHTHHHSLRLIYELLEEAHGFQGWWPLGSRAGSSGHDDEGYRRSPDVVDRLDDRDRVEIAVGAILTQNTAWENARAALASLREADALNAVALDRLPVETVAATIRSSGYFNQKARKIKSFARFLQGEGAGGVYAPGTVPERDDLLGLWGIGPETADSILLYAYGRPVFVVDAYARRIMSRLGALSGAQSYEEVQRRFHGELPPDSELYGEYHALLVRHGRRFCRSRPLCGACPLRVRCEFARHAQVTESPES